MVVYVWNLKCIQRYMINNEMCCEHNFKVRWVTKLYTNISQYNSELLNYTLWQHYVLFNVHIHASVMKVRCHYSDLDLDVIQAERRSSRSSFSRPCEDLLWIEQDSSLWDCMTSTTVENSPKRMLGKVHRGLDIERMGASAHTLDCKLLKSMIVVFGWLFAVVSEKESASLVHHSYASWIDWYLWSSLSTALDLVLYKHKRNYVVN